MPVDQATQLSNIQNSIQELKASMDTDQLFNVLEIIRDAVSNLSHQHESIRADLRDVRNIVIQSTTAD